MTVSYHTGIDYFTKDLDKKETLYCLVCEAKLQIEKSNGPRSWAGAMSRAYAQSCKTYEEHWTYYCPNTKYSGHSYLVALYKEGKNFTSKRLKELVFDELHEARKDFLAGPMKEE